MITFNKNSLHYFLATKLANYEAPHLYRYYGDEEPTLRGDSGDLCTYSKHVLTGSVIAAVIGITIGFAGWLLSNLIFGVYFSIMMDQWMFSVWGEVTLIVAVVVSIATSITMGLKEISKVMRKVPNKLDSNSFMSHMYKAWKGKFCVQIEFKD